MAADTVSTKVLFGGAGSKTYAINLYGLSNDGTGESAITKVDISALVNSAGSAPTTVKITDLAWAVQGHACITLLFDKSGTDEVIARCSGNDYRNYGSIGGLSPSSAAGTNDLLLTTVGAATNASYDITVVMEIE